MEVCRGLQSHQKVPVEQDAWVAWEHRQALGRPGALEGRLPGELMSDLGLG